jgi:hypothetical protein
MGCLHTKYRDFEENDRHGGDLEEEVVHHQSCRGLGLYVCRVGDPPTGPARPSSVSAALMEGAEHACTAGTVSMFG